MSAELIQNDPPRRVILLRHGQTSWNAQERWQGQRDIPLDSVGLAQAERAAVDLVRDSSIVALTCSDLRRAAQTATVLQGAFDLAGRPLRRRVDARFREIDMGQWSGLTHEEVAAQFPAETAALDGGGDLRRGIDGETMGEASARCRAGFDDVVAVLDAGESAVVVLHGAVLRGLVGDLVGVDVGTLRRALRAVGNCHWVVLQEDRATWRVESWNVGPH